MIEIQGVSKQFSTRRNTHQALDGIDLSVAEGEFVCLVGPSGCGKTTLLNIIAGLERPDGGRVLLGGQPVQGPGPDRCIMFQEAALFPWLTVAKNVEFAVELAGVPRGEWAMRVEHHLRMVHLWRFRDAHVHELSGGMRQRAALARALAAHPQVLLMDEPFAAVDAETRDVLHGELMDLWSRYRKTVIFVTHNLSEAVRLGDRVVIMATGPGRVQAVHEIDMARPRKREGEVARHVGRITRVMRGEVEKVMREEQDEVALRLVAGS